MTIGTPPSRKAAVSVLTAAMCGAAATYGTLNGHWGLVVGSSLGFAWVATIVWITAMRGPFATVTPESDAPSAEREDKAVAERLLFDAVPIPLVAIDRGIPRALNRAARTLFSTDDRIIPCPSALTDTSISHFTYATRVWRINRVVAHGAKNELSLAVLVDVEEDRLATEMAATSELIEILSHELMNGLAPIVSLAESAQATAQRKPCDQNLMLEILGPLTRRAEGLHRFATSYHSLAKLPQPDRQSVAIAEVFSDLRQASEQKWPSVKFNFDVQTGIVISLDVDQIHQALWAILQNSVESLALENEMRIDVTVKRHQEYLQIAITDLGSGVPVESVPFIFRPFYTTKRTGSGIGLALARQIARAHGGNLELSRRVPTTFAMKLPLPSLALQQP